jgi:hypothetical protein
MITANEPIQTTDPTSGLARRRLTIPFNNPFKGTAAQQHVLIDMDGKGNAYGRFASLLPGLVNWVLDLSHVEMKELLMETAKTVPFYVGYQTEQVLKSCPTNCWTGCITQLYLNLMWQVLWVLLSLHHREVLVFMSTTTSGCMPLTVSSVSTPIQIS